MNWSKSEVIEKLKEAFEAGASKREAADYAGCSQMTAHSWRHRLGLGKDPKAANRFVMTKWRQGRGYSIESHKQHLREKALQHVL